ncbi:MAG: SDR family NAD(P)-dependent oxidoreductase [Ahrensia sp.]|nr:SDR family NAD(P)-dependent oxidoreductase [Ahrensia sp.]
MSDIATYPSLRDKTVIVTGGGSGIGEAIVSRFAEQGARVGFVDIAEEASQALVERLVSAGHTVKFVACDITDTEALKAAIGSIRERFGPVGILINNAAHDQRHKFEDITPEFFDERIAVNIKHQFFAAQAVIPDMQALSGGTIINMGSTSWMVGQGGMACYTAAKSAVLGLTRSLARDFGGDNIRVLSVVPGWIMTERQKTLWLTEESEKDLMKSQCLKRHLLPDDIARPVLFFASDEAGAATNQAYVFDGGWI